MRPHSLARLAPLVLVVASALAGPLACVPHPGGECTADAECGYGLTCQSGLCRTRPARACLPACSAGLHCDDGTCALDSPPTLTWSAPADGSFVASGSVGLALSVATAAADFSVSVTARPLGGGADGPSLALSPDGPSLRGLLDAGTLAERDWLLVPTVHAAGRDYAGPPRLLRVDRSGPLLVLRPPQPGGAAFARSAVITLYARLQDAGVGVDAASVVVAAPGMDPIAGERLNQIDWRFTVPLSAPTLRAAEGPVTLTLRARDQLGNASEVAAAVPVTRLLWQRDVGQGLPVRSSPALDARHVYVGTDAARLVAVDRTSAELLWTRQLQGPVSASPARGSSLVYAASEGGEVGAFDPESGEPRWSCPGLPTGLSFLSSPAVFPLALPGGAPVEAIALQNRGTFQLGAGAVQGGLFVLQGAVGLPVGGGAVSCWLLGPSGGGRSSPAVAADGALYVGGDDGQARKLRLFADGAGAFALHPEWSRAATDDLGTSPALTTDGVVFADDSGHLMQVGTDGIPQQADAALGEKLLASPVIAFRSVLLQGRDGDLGVFGPGPVVAPQPGPGFRGSHLHLDGASAIASTPAVGADGTIYVAAGRSLRALAPDGTQLWEVQLQGAATSSSPTLGCDGTLYVGDAAGALTAVVTDSRGLAPGWARFRHDARGTGNAGSSGCE